jgi:hypothetical protein
MIDTGVFKFPSDVIVIIIIKFLQERLRAVFYYPCDATLLLLWSIGWGTCGSILLSLRRDVFIIIIIII